MHFLAISVHSVSEEKKLSQGNFKKLFFETRKLSTEILMVEVHAGILKLTLKMVMF